MPFRIRVVPGSVPALVFDHLLGAAQCDIPVAFLPCMLEEAPIGEDPVALRLQIIIGIFPWKKGKITLDEAPDSPVEPHAGIRAKYTASVPMRDHHKPMQLFCRMQALWRL